MTDYSEPAKNPKERGQSLVEFALVLLFVILPFIFVISDGAMTLFTYTMVTNAAREGARAASIYQTATSQGAGQPIDAYIASIDSTRTGYALQQAQRAAGVLVPFSQCSTVLTYTPAIPDMANPYRALDSASFSLACPRSLLFGLLPTGQITLSAQATMRIEPGGVFSPTLPTSP